MKKITNQEYRMYLLGYGDGLKRLRIRTPRRIAELLAMEPAKQIPLADRSINEKRAADTATLDVLDA
jgi:hypothetical protein